MHPQTFEGDAEQLPVVVLSAVRVSPRQLATMTRQSVEQARLREREATSSMNSWLASCSLFLQNAEVANRRFKWEALDARKA